MVRKLLNFPDVMIYIIMCGKSHVHMFYNVDELETTVNSLISFINIFIFEAKSPTINLTVDLLKLSSNLH